MGFLFELSPFVHLKIISRQKTVLATSSNFRKYNLFFRYGIKSPPKGASTSCVRGTKYSTHPWDGTVWKGWSLVDQRQGNIFRSFFNSKNMWLDNTFLQYSISIFNIWYINDHIAMTRSSNITGEASIIIQSSQVRPHDAIMRMPSYCYESLVVAKGGPWTTVIVMLPYLWPLWLRSVRKGVDTFKGDNLRTNYREYIHHREYQWRRQLRTIYYQFLCHSKYLQG